MISISLPAAAVADWEKNSNREVAMPQKRLLHSIDTIRSLRTTTKCHEQLVRDIEAMCRHDGEVLCYQPKFYDDREDPVWWTHIQCRKCEAAYAALLDTPLCVACHERMLRADRSPCADAIAEALLVADKYATEVPVFECMYCHTLCGFPMRIDTKKAPAR
jgi:hypothetical protein